MDLLTIITTSLAIAAAAGGGASIFYATRSRNLITLLKDENSALLGSNTRLEKDLEVANTKLEAVQKERDIWRDNVTQAPSIKEMTETMGQQHIEVVDKIGNVVSAIAGLTQEISKERRR